MCSLGNCVCICLFTNKRMGEGHTCYYYHRLLFYLSVLALLHRQNLSYKQLTVEYRVPTVLSAYKFHIVLRRGLLSINSI